MLSRNSVARLANLNEDVANQIRSVGYSVETNPYVRAKIRNEDIVGDGAPARGVVVDTDVNRVTPDVEEPVIVIPRGQFDDSEFVMPDIPSNLRMLTSGDNTSLVFVPRKSRMGSYSRQLNGWIPSRRFRM